jgi:hypothetical protein
MPESVSQHCKAFLVSQQIKGAMDRTILHCRDDFKRHISIKLKLKDLNISRRILCKLSQTILRRDVHQLPYKQRREVGPEDFQTYLQAIEV